MKLVHKALKLRHHKHTGKLLQHKHTSYRVLFLLMLAPIFMMALVGQLAIAADYEVTAIVHAPMPGGSPTITTPVNGATTNSATLPIAGTCPVIVPAIIIAIYEGPTVIGSQQCTVGGTFSVPVTVTAGEHTVVATVVTITNQIGGSSSPVTFTYIPEYAPPVTPPPAQPGATTTTPKPTSKPTTPPKTAPLTITSDQAVIMFGPQKDAVWRGSFSGGTPPYKIVVKWGDGSTNSYTIGSPGEQAFTHHYTKDGSYNIRIEVTDSDGNTAVHSSVAASPTRKPVPTVSSTISGSGGNEFNFWTLFTQLPLMQIYLASLFALLFLWYLEHGRHKLHTILLAKQPHRSGRV